MTGFVYEMETLELRNLAPPRGREPAERVFACDHAGHCEMKDAIDAVREGLLARLNERGARGWRLAHMDLHAEVVLLVWERPDAA